MKKTLLLFLLSVSILSANAVSREQQRIDSLEALLSSTTDTTRMSILLTLCGDYMKADPEKLLAYATELTELGRTSGNWNYEAQGLRYKGIGLKETGDYTESGKAYLQALKIFESHHDLFGVASCHNSLGALYFNLNELDKAESYYLKCIEQSKKAGMDKYLPSAYNNLGAVYAMQKKYNQALMYFNEGLKLRLKQNDQYGIASSYGNLGRIYTVLGRFKEALEFQKKSLSIRETLKDEEGVANTLNNIGEIFLDQEYFSEAVIWFNKGLAVAQQFGYQELIRSSYEALSECYEGLKNYAAAHEYLSLSVAIKDSMMNIENRNHLEELTTQYETEKKEQQIKILAKNNEIKEAENSRKQLYIYLILSGSAVVVVLLFVLMRMYKQKELANQKLKKLDQEKNEFLSLAATDLKNPLSTIIGYCRMQADYFDKLNKEKILKHSANIKLAAGKMVDLISNLLDVNAIEQGRMKNNPERIDLNKFFDDLFKEFEQQAKEKNITFKLDNSGGNYHVHADPRLLTQVTENLLANSLKNTASNTQVFIKLLKKGDKAGYELTDPVTQKTTEEDAVLGMSILKRMLNIMQAEIEVKNDSLQGSVVTILLSEG